MILGHKNPDALLYHYTSAEIAKEKILSSCTLKLGRFDRTNDPKESREWEFSLCLGEEKRKGPSGLDEISKELSYELKARTKLACFSCDIGPLTGDQTKDILLRGYSLPRMWAQYGENHTGVCLVFDRDKLENQILSQFGEDASIHASKVFYRDRSFLESLDDPAFTINGPLLWEVGMKKYGRLHREQYFHRFYLEKACDWQNEREFRFILFSDHNRDLFVYYGDSLVGLMFGDSVGKENFHEILGITDSLNIDRMGLKWSNSCPWYDYGRSDYSSKSLTPMPQSNSSSG